MLAVYLHHDSSVLSNVFCTQAMCTDSVAAFLDENFVTFGWDVTSHSNKQRAIQMMTEHFGSIAATTVRKLDIERFPLLALVYKLRGTIEIFQIIHGNVTLDELMSQLLSASETYHSQLAVEVEEEREREERNAVKREQDLAFEMAQQVRTGLSVVALRAIIKNNCFFRPTGRRTSRSRGRPRQRPRRRGRSKRGRRRRRGSGGRSRRRGRPSENWYGLW